MNDISVDNEDENMDEKRKHRRKDTRFIGISQPMVDIEVRRSSVGICKLDDVLELYRKEISYEKLTSSFDEVKKCMEKQSIMIDNVFDVVRITMEHVEQSNIFDTGIERKQYVIAILKLISLEKKMVSNDISRNLIRLINTNMLNDLIELLIYASKGYLNINKRKRWFC